MPYALKPILVADDATTQREHVRHILGVLFVLLTRRFHQFLALWEADGVQAEPHDSD